MKLPRPAPTVLVIGAGIAGMSAARSLSQAGVNVKILERDDRVGGRIYTAMLEGIPVDLGAGFLTNFYPRTLHLAEELGLGKMLVPIKTTGAIVRDGRPQQVWPLRRFMSSQLVPHRSKVTLLKAAWPILRHWGQLDSRALWRSDGLDTRSVAEYAATALDQYILEFILQPCLSGFLYWTPEQTSQALLFILLKQALALRCMLVPASGMAMLTERLAEVAEVSLGTEAIDVRASAGGYEVLVRKDGRERRLTADAVVCATTATSVPHLFPGLNPSQRDFFQEFEYSSTISVALQSSTRIPLTLQRFLVPRQSARHLAAVTVRSADPAAAPSSRDVVMLFASDEGAHALLEAGDETIIAQLLGELRTAVPAFSASWDQSRSVVQRWPEALPKFGVGHLRRLRQFVGGAFEDGEIAFAGDYLGGPFVEGAVRSGQDAAARVLSRLGLTTSRRTPISP